MLNDVTGTSIEGDVTVKAECKHENAIYPEITDSQHKITCSCGYEVTEAHNPGENGKCVCGKVIVATVTVGGSTTYYTTADGAFSAAEDAIDNDSTATPTVTILANASVDTTVDLRDNKVSLVVNKDVILSLNAVFTWAAMFPAQAPLPERAIWAYSAQEPSAAV